MTVLVLVGLYLVLVLEAAGRARSTAVIGLCLVLLALYGVILAFGGPRDFFELAVPNAGDRALVARRRGARDRPGSG